MDKQKFIQLLESRGKGSAEVLDELRALVDEHPYFTPARLLLLKALQENEHLSFPLELKRTAAHIARRERLFEWVSRPLAQAESREDRSVLSESKEGREAQQEAHEAATDDKTVSLPEEKPKANPLEKAPNSSGEESAKEAPKSPERREEDTAPSRIEARPIPDWVNDPAAAARQRVKELLAQKRGERLPNAPASEAAPKPAPTPTEPQEAQRDELPPSASADSAAPLVREKPASKPSPRPDTSSEELKNSETPVSEEQPEAPSPKTTTAKLDASNPASDAPTKTDPAASPYPPEESETAADSTDSSPQSIDIPAETTRERLSFGAWLDRLSDTADEDEPKHEPDLIERFLQHPPSFKPRKATRKEESRDIAKDSLRENPEIMTETLARLYTEQGHFAKAIEAYEILSLRFPEKSSFFAGRAKELKKRLKDRT